MVLRKIVKNRGFSWLGLALAGAASFAQLGLLAISAHIPAAYAQSFNDDEIASYARAVFEIEASRVSAYEAASDILAAADSELSILETPLSCANSRLSDMPDLERAERVDLRTVLVTFCNEASQIAEDNDLTPKTFNAITAAHREDEELATLIQAAVSELE